MRGARARGTLQPGGRVLVVVVVAERMKRGAAAVTSAQRVNGSSVPNAGIIQAASTSRCNQSDRRTVVKAKRM